MEKIVNFIQNYWQYIGVVIVIIIEFIIIICKKKPKSHDEFVLAIQECLIKVPLLVCLAEESMSGSLEKKEFVLHSLLTYIQKALGHELNDSQLDYFYNSVSPHVEKVLSCPTKKGGYGREEDE